ncbi:hypothetical protein AK812_SmicGene11198 [Symbiodinium microadriaticum]|uniref:Uncharacterized protein n=1 Tax=Symbiodinium microadriaticum TaxID=2951 RepID=A0A1Q9EDT7_SYMMI|nr:hypothetical protein AK812_SmicGene11198 [Symbiodinium microadriaticum]
MLTGGEAEVEDAWEAVRPGRGLERLFLVLQSFLKSTEGKVQLFIGPGCFSGFLQAAHCAGEQDASVGNLTVDALSS